MAVGEGIYLCAGKAEGHGFFCGGTIHTPQGNVLTFAR